MKATKIFITIEVGDGKLQDYPNNVPLPRSGERVIFNGVDLHVTNVKHIVQSGMVEIKIITINN